ncbi:MAG: outer membrane beta-barrel protein, partial [Bacteroidetes bacterium]|nr:outer membrane beta-barrel protein [Bacteroidota bacterium]
FENDVQQKMTELEFTPSAAVWANVEKALNKRERRGLPFFWRLALPGLLLLLAGGGYYFFTNRTTPATETTSATASHSAPVPAANTAPAPAITATSDARTTPAPPAAPAKAPSTASTAAVTPAAAAPAASISIPGAAKAPIRTLSELTVKNDGLSSKKTRTKAKTTAKPKPEPETAAKTELADASITVDNGAASPTGPIQSAAAAAPERTHYAYSPSLIGLNKSRSAIRAKQPTPQAITLQNLQPKYPWEAAFVGGAGVSSLHQMQLSNVSLRASDLPAYNALPSGTGITQMAATPSKNYVSTVRPGPSFWAGVEAYKQLSSRWGLSIGVDLRYYSNIVHVGQQVNSYTPTSASYFTSSGFAPIQSYPYYSAGDDERYTNRYYFLELPVALEYKLNKSKLMPIFLNGGASLAYLMGSSAVYYNTKSGVYFKDGNVANKMQVSLSTAVMVGLPIHNIRVQVGPQIQYGLTPLLNTEQSGEQHVFYGGIRFVVFPGKK